MVILRDPVERLHSAYYYYGCKHNHTRLARTRTQNGNYSPENFHEWAQVGTPKLCLILQLYSIEYGFANYLSLHISLHEERILAKIAA